MLSAGACPGTIGFGVSFLLTMRGKYGLKALLDLTALGPDDWALLETTAADFDRLIGVNLRGPSWSVARRCDR